MVDLHCDTISEAYFGRKSLQSNDLHLDIKRLIEMGSKLQCFACFCKKSDGRALEIYLKQMDFFKLELKKNKIPLILTKGNLEDALKNNSLCALLCVEDGLSLENDASNLDIFFEMGVRLLTISWNEANGFSYPNFSLDEFKPELNKGLTENGKILIKKMESMGVLLDISHLSDKGFLEVCEISTRPFLASHSGARSVCPHVRNLTDSQIKKIAEHDGIIGVPFVTTFLGSDGVQSFIKHIKHIRKLVGHKVVAIGSDFDGSRNMLFKSVSETEILFKTLKASGLSSLVSEDILENNALNFFLKNLP